MIGLLKKERLMRWLVPLALAAISGLGCHRGPDLDERKAAYEEKLKSWLNADINKFIQEWGPPSSTFDQPNGNKVYTWKRSSQGAVARPVFGGGAVVQNYSLSCDVHMTADPSGKIVYWRYFGNQCF